jgi:hypothetical protein
MPLSSKSLAKTSPLGPPPMIATDGDGSIV